MTAFGICARCGQDAKRPFAVVCPLCGSGRCAACVKERCLCDVPQDEGAAEWCDAPEETT